MVGVGSLLLRHPQMVCAISECEKGIEKFLSGEHLHYTPYIPLVLRQYKRVQQFDEHFGQILMPSENHIFYFHFHIYIYYVVIQSCRLHPLPYLFGIAFYKGDDAVMVFGVGVAYATALYHFQRPQIHFHRFDALSVNPCG